VSIVTKEFKQVCAIAVVASLWWTSLATATVLFIPTLGHSWRFVSWVDRKAEAILQRYD